MEKNAILKVRVTEDLQADFLAVCEALGRTPAAVLRELVEQQVAAHALKLEDDVRITIERPTDYEYGAWRARMSLRSPEAMEFMGGPIPFRIPQLPARRIHPDKGFRIAAAGWDGKGPSLDGIFVDGVWEGHIYSNGTAEAENPTSMETVVEELKAVVRERLSTLSV